ncbi:unnamed protein product, partial [Amoebophrya sp. A25]|eukprot:GSA25T00027350001.1
MKLQIKMRYQHVDGDQDEPSNAEEAAEPQSASTSRFFLLSKGSPKRLASMGTMSEVDSREAAQYARQGFYTLAVAMREVDSAFVRQVVGGDLFSAGKAGSDSTEEVMLRRSDV